MDEAGQDALKCSRAGDHVTALRDVLERLLHWLLPADLKSCNSAKRLPTRKLREGKEGGDAEWAVPQPPLMFSENCVHQRRRRNCRDGLHAQQKTQIHVDQG